MTDGLEVESWQGLLVHDVVSVCHPEPGREAWSLVINVTNACNDFNDLSEFNKPAPIFTALFI